MILFYRSMSAPTEQFTWLVGLPTGVRTRVCYDSPNGAHPLTPEVVRKRYLAEVRNSELVFWHMADRSIGGVRAGIDEVAWNDADIEYFETSFCRPAKGAGYALLSARMHDGKSQAIVASDQYDRDIHDWHLAAAGLLERIYPGLVRTRDDGYDA